MQPTSPILEVTSTYNGQPDYDMSFPLQEGDTFYGECGIWGAVVDGNCLGTDVWVFEARTARMFSIVLISERTLSNTKILTTIKRQIGNDKADFMTIEPDTQVVYSGDDLRMHFNVTTLKLDTTGCYIDALEMEVVGWYTGDRNSKNKTKRSPIQPEEYSGFVGWVKRLLSG